jgi:hypothetical protein
MSQHIDNRSKIKAFVVGAIFGLVVYALYIKTLATGRNEVLAIDLGSVYFPFQYFFSLAFPLDFSGESGDVSGTVFGLFTMAAVLYGYIFLSIRLSPYLAVGTFLVSSSLFLFLLVTYPEGPSVILQMMFWEGTITLRALGQAEFGVRQIRIFLTCCTVGLWYVGLICGLRTLFRPFSGEAKNEDDRNSTFPISKTVVQCPKCSQQLRAPASTIPVNLRCPSCQTIFQFMPQE